MDMVKTWRTMMVTQLAIALVCLSVFSLGLNSLHAAASLNNKQSVPAPIPTKAEPVKPPKVDYQKIDNMIQQRIADLPKPKDGQNGADGKDGARGENGKNAKPADVSVSLTPEFRSNPLSHNLEWRYVGDDSWQLLLNACLLTNSCVGAP